MGFDCTNMAKYLEGQEPITVWDVCVIGAGIVGSATALSIAKDGKKVLLIEKFPLPHSRGSSHGQTRVIRHTYGQLCYSEMMPEAYKLWKEIEERTGTQLLIKTGLVNLDTWPFRNTKEFKRNLEAMTVNSKFIEGEEFQQTFPMLKYGMNYGGLIEHDAGILKADRCGQCIRKLFEENYHGCIKDAEEVLSIIAADPVVIYSSKKIYKAKKVVITAGPFTNKLLNPLGLDLPLKPERVNVCYWKVDDKWYRAEEGFPTWAVSGSEGTRQCQLYGLPCYEYPNLMKVCLHYGKKVDPESRDFDDLANTEDDIQTMSRYLKDHFIGIGDKPHIIEKCIYTMTPDFDFILDCHPHYKNIIIGAGFSGHGFKMAPVIGKILSELTQGKTLSYDLTPFKISRFKNHKSSL